MTEQPKQSPTRKQQRSYNHFNSYTELSPSGTGLHILAYGQLPGKGIHTAIEMYGQDRFTTITTNHLQEHHQRLNSDRKHLTHSITDLHQQSPKPPIRTQGGVFGAGNATELPPEAEYDAVLQRLLSGDIAGYPSPSNADFVLIMKLLHWTGDNVELTRSIFLVLSTRTAREGTAQNRTDHLC